MGTPGYLTTIKLGGTPTALTNEPCSKVTANTVYQITDLAKRILDRDTAVVVEVDADGAGAGPFVVADPATYTIDYLFGKVTFLADQGVDAVVRIASGKYLPVTVVAGANKYGLNCGGTLLDRTDYENAQASNGHRTRAYGMHDASLTLGRFEDATKTFSDALKDRKTLLMEVRPGGSGDYFRAFMVVESDNKSGELDADEMDELSFQLSGDKNTACSWGQ